jgi:hypothetical protein
MSSVAPVQDEIQMFFSCAGENLELFLKSLSKLSPSQLEGNLGEFTRNFLRKAGWPSLANNQSIIEMQRRAKDYL